MNKQKLIDYLKGHQEWSGNHHYILVQREELISMIGQISEPQKVKVKQFIADWYEEHKEDINSAIFELCEAGKEPVDLDEGLTEFGQWFYLNNDIETLIRMLDGYEIEEEPKWVVRVGDKLLFKEFDDNEFPVFVIDDKPGSIQLAENFELENKAQNVQKEVGGKVEKV